MELKQDANQSDFLAQIDKGVIARRDVHSTEESS
jgi:hypothetical protein